jgi:hypothetical protein
VIAAVFLAYVGVQSFLAVVRACGALKDATDRATTFQELEEAADAFAQALGPEVARVFVLAVTMLVSHGVTAGLSSALAVMPRFPGAVRLGPARVLDVSAVAVVGGVVEVTLASTAVTMAVVGPPPSGGPGKWVQVNESMSDRARDYQAQVTGAPKGSAYRLQEGDTVVDFDGYDPVESMLLEAKGPGYAQFITDKMEMKGFFTGFRKMLVQADRQLAMAQGRRIRWIVAEERFATFLKKVFSETGRRIEVLHTSPLQ